MLKDGDRLLQELELKAQRARIARVLWLALAGWDYAPEWFYWMEFGKAVRN